jgi:serine/threonine protein kinase
MTRFTKDMNREGFSVYNKRWKREFEGMDKGDMSNISPYKLILREQGKKEDKRLALAWGLINKMLDPNPLTRITAPECLRSPLFTKDARVSRLISDFQKEYTTRTRALPGPNVLSLGNTSGLYLDIVKMRSLSSVSVAAHAFLEKDTAFAERLERMVRVVDHKMGNILYMEGVSDVHKEIINFCIMVLASYAEYPSKNKDRPNFEMEFIMSNPNQLENMRSRFIEHYSGDISFLEKMIYTMTYFLLVEVFEFDLWL